MTQPKGMDYEQYLLGKLAEEAAEVAQIALKAQQFGLHERFQEGPSNHRRIRAELNDLMGVVSALNDHAGFSFEPDGYAMSSKRIKIETYRQYSQSLGKTVEHTGDSDYDAA